MPKRKNTSPKNSVAYEPGAAVPSALNLRVLAAGAIIVLTTFLAYFPSESGGFILDDDGLLTASPLIMASDGLYRFWFTAEAIDYWPVSNSTLWIEWRVWGMNPTGYHHTNLILHIVNSLLIWLLLRRLSIPGAFLAALLFAVHPVNVESVAWIASRKNMVSMLFFLLSILWYLKADIPAPTGPPTRFRLYRPGTGRWYWLSMLAFLLAMLSKGSVAVLPILLVCIIWWRRPVTKLDLARTVPFFMVALVLGGVNVWFQTHGMDRVFRTAGVMERLLGAGGVIWFYIYKALLPLDLIFLYPMWNIQADNPLWWLPLFAAVIVTAVLLWYGKSWSRPVLFAWSFFCIALVPVMGFTDVAFMRFSLVADRYQYIALIGILALLAAHWDIWNQRAQGLARSLAKAVAVAAAITLVFLTMRQSGLYREPLTLYQATLKKNPNCPLIHDALGVFLYKTGRSQEAIEHCAQALWLKPDYPEANNNLGNALLKIGRSQEAIHYYERAIQLAPDFADAHYNLGIALAHKNQFQAAVLCFRQALKLNPASVATHNNLGNALVQTGQCQEAINHYQQALRLKPDLTNVYLNMALTYAEMHQSSDAVAMAQKGWELARSKGQHALAKQIEDWLMSYRAGQSNLPSTPPSRHADSTPP